MKCDENVKKDPLNNLHGPITTTVASYWLDYREGNVYFTVRMC